MTRRSFPSVSRPKGRPAARILALVSAGVVLLSSLGLGAFAGPVQAVDESVSSVTVKWAGGNPSQIQQRQPDHAGLLSDGHGNDAGSGHWDDFKNLEVTVSKTRGLIDEAVTITATGMAGTTFPAWAGGQASNYLQVFQCWGPDPLAVNFAETCQYGSWSQPSGDRAAGEAIKAAIGLGANTRGEFSAGGEIPFRTATGETNKPYDVSGEGTLNGLSTFFTASNSNELPYVGVSSDMTARTEFEVQSAASQPYLGCGSTKLAGPRCWLVVVPRGVHSGEVAPGSTLSCFPSNYGARAYGETNHTQLGSPLSPDCSYWQDRIVVPLDFAPVGSQCDVGGAEVNIVGSELVSTAMSSWQQGLCAVNGNVYSIATNSGAVLRSQLLTDQARMSIVANPLTAGSIGNTDPALLDQADIAYAPVANTGLVISYVASTSGGTQLTDLKITPRLLAKVLTQSYRMDVPWVDGREQEELLDSYWPKRPALLQEDPEMVALNHLATTNNMLPAAFGAFVVSGPHGEDTVELLWRYIQADADAVAFLKGEPDPWGNTINPYYLPAGHPGARGTGLPVDLSTHPIDTFLKSDQTLAPADPAVSLSKYNGKQIDSLSLLPYSGSLAANATRVFRANTRYTNLWDPNKQNSAGEFGAFSAAAPQVASNGRFTVGPTDAATARRYGLATMQLALPLSSRTSPDDLATARVFVAPTEASMTAALGAMKTDGGTGLSTIDFSSLPKDAYPLTATLYGAVNLASKGLAATNRDQLAGFLDFTAGAGNVRGDAAGLLPNGYVPLTAAQATQSAGVSKLLRNPANPTKPGIPGTAPTTTQAGTTPVGTSPVGTSPVGTTPVGTAAAGAASAGTSQALAAAVPATTAASTAPAQVILGGSLLAGIAGLIAAPFLLRRRGTAG